MADVKKAGGGGAKGGRSKDWPNYKEDEQVLRDFLTKYTDDNGRAVYADQLQAVANRRSKVITVEIEHIAAFAKGYGEGGAAAVALAANITRNARSYQRILCGLLDELMPAATEDYAEDIIDIQMKSRQQRVQDVAAADAAGLGVVQDVKLQFPPELTRRYQLLLTPGGAMTTTPLRHVRSDVLGSLVKCKGVVTRVGDVVPMARVMTYTCDNCGNETYQPVDAREFMPLKDCPSAKCKNDNQKSPLTQQTRASVFTKFQEIRLQEDAAEVPVGHIPRSLTLYVYGELTRQCVPGDVITVGGVYLPIPYTGFRAIRAGLTTDTYVEVTSLYSEKKSYTDLLIGDDEREEVTRLSGDKDIYSKLASSIAPEIYGQVDVKKAILLTLVGGVTRKLPDLKIRGDINVLLMGDPGVAKSQLLKHVTRIAPRSVYTTGKGSSGVGLTAAVIRDPHTGEMSLEGGALVLADKGICCIDEFDKMEDSDKTAIHEVMEQQSVSIAKAGIITTLNARTAIIAAANPAFGSWNPRVTAEANLNLPTALLSRFDLTFVLLDEVNEESDEALAKHITHVHMHSAPPKLHFDVVKPNVLRNYISEARKKTPFIPPELDHHISSLYIGLRQESNQQLKSARGRSWDQANPRAKFCTARMLLSVLRLSQALARLHFRDAVTKADVEEAERLMWASRQSGDSKSEKKAQAADPITAVYHIIVGFAKANQTQEVLFSDVRGSLTRKGLTDAHLKACVRDYVSIGLWVESREGVRLVDDSEGASQS